MQNIVGIFDNEIDAHTAISQLLDSGFKKQDVSLIVSDHSRHFVFAPPTDDQGARATEGGAAGALIGGALGALFGGLMLVGAVVTPGAQVLAAGPLVSALSGAGAGAIAGGISGALISAGFAADEAKRYEDEIKQGHAVIIVHSSDEMAAAARVVLRSSNARIKAA